MNECKIKFDDIVKDCIFWRRWIIRFQGLQQEWSWETCAGVSEDFDHVGSFSPLSIQPRECLYTLIDWCWIMNSRIPKRSMQSKYPDSLHQSNSNHQLVKSWPLFGSLYWCFVHYEPARISDTYAYYAYHLKQRISV